MTVMGLESELHVCTPAMQTREMRDRFMAMFLARIAETVPSVPNREANHIVPGVMTVNGSRIYQDGSMLIEIATPEVRDPLEAVTSLRANELILLEAAAQAISLGEFRAPVRLVRCATSYDGNYRGVHLNVSTRHITMSDIVEHLIPFLVTRFYACAGGLGSRGFVMTHKRAAIKKIVTGDARNDRGIIHITGESLSCSGHQRLHVTYGDQTMSTVATYLALGCTALVIMMLDEGASVGPAFKLLDPLAAIHQLDTDYAWSQPLDLASGGHASALDIQEHYLMAGETYARRAGDPWMKTVTAQWRKCVDALRADGPVGLSQDIDAFVKMRLYGAYLRRRGITLSEFSSWCGPLELTRPHLVSAPARGIQAYLRERMPAMQFDQLIERMERASLAWAALHDAASLYNAMRSIDLLYHDIAENALFERLRRAGAVHSVIQPEATRRAMRNPPLGTRAQARARAIFEAGDDSQTTATWMEVRTSSRIASFPDPLRTTLTWKERKKR